MHQRGGSLTPPYVNPENSINGRAHTRHRARTMQNSNVCFHIHKRPMMPTEKCPSQDKFLTHHPLYKLNKYIQEIAEPKSTFDLRECYSFAGPIHSAFVAKKVLISLRRAEPGQRKKKKKKRKLSTLAEIQYFVNPTDG